MKSILKYFAFAGLLLAVGCETTPEQPQTEDTEVYVELIADRETITADGVDVVRFTVTVNSEDRTADAMIINVADNSTVEGGVFTTTEAGSHTFVAAYGKHSSEQKTIVAVAPEVKEPEVELTADTLTIKADGEQTVTFTVTADGEDVTAESQIKFVMDGNALEGNTFKTKAYGSYEFVASYRDYTSNTLIIKVTKLEEPTPTPPVVGDYRVGDLYDVDGVKGVIYGFMDRQVTDEDGNRVTKTYCYIMSMDQASLAWSTENVWCNCISDKGDWNTEDMLYRYGTSPDKYPAAQWCVAHGEGWFMPSSEELHLMWSAVSGGTYVFDEAKVALFNDKLDDPFEQDFYWSSNETNDEMAEVVAFMDDSVVCLDPLKSKPFCVRAVYKFEVTAE